MFDVVITSYRRPSMTLAAVNSCLAQGALLEQVIVVDDASGDETIGLLSNVQDPRLMLVARETNGGIGAARATGLALSRADWTVQIDSDHELLPGALETLRALAESTCSGVQILGGRFRWDTGGVSPVSLPDGLVDYRRRIELCSAPDSIGTDYVCCLGADLRSRVKWESKRSGLVDVKFHLDAAKLSDAIFSPACLALQKSDGAEGNTRGPARLRFKRRLLDASDGADLAVQILDDHGEALRHAGGPFLASILTQGAFFASLAGRRGQALSWISDALFVRGASYTNLAGAAVAALGGPKVAQLLYQFRDNL